MLELSVGNLFSGATEVRREHDVVGRVGEFELNRVAEGDCLALIPRLPDASLDVVVTSPPYWGQRQSKGTGTEDDPRAYLRFLTEVFVALLPKLKDTGIIWINLGDSFNTPVNWGPDDWKYSSLGPDGNGFAATNAAYTKPRARRRAFIEASTAWLQYGNLLALPYRLIIALCDQGYLFRGEVIWRKKNPMPEGRCRRPHRHHEPIYLLAKREAHAFRIKPPVKSVWEFSNENIDGISHRSRFPEELPTRCIDSYGQAGQNVVVLDPFAGSGTTGIAALKLGCSFLGFEIDHDHVEMANSWLARVEQEVSSYLSWPGIAATRGG
ncbi:MAG: site-specific DNA-methyltransferase [Planctomycetes bacterium]|nr:site-specific DNA-methyltransferase [Planctomycetota bacterium]